MVHGLGGEVRPLAVGPDGRIYGTGTRGNQVGLYIYDPKLGKVVKDFGDGGCACGGGRSLEEAAERSGDELSSREFPRGDHLLDHERRGNRAEHNPERGHSHAEARLQRVELRGRIEKPDGLVRHEIQNPLCDERRDGPAERPQ